MKVPEVKISKVSYSPYLYYNRQKSAGSDIEWGRGFYIGEVHTVSIYSSTGFNDRPPSTDLEIKINDYVYQRRYTKTFSDAGLKLICARFIKDVINLYEMD
jgi:hypothetical protein